MGSSPLRRHGEGQERDLVRPLGGERRLALVARGVAADAARDDLAALRDEVLERLRVLVVDDQGLVGAVAADALAPDATAAGSVRVEVRRAAELAVVHVVVAAAAAAPATTAAAVVVASLL